MIDLDSKKAIEDYDKGKVLESIRKLPAQVEQAWTEMDKLEIPKACYLAKNVVIAGMGGSSLSGRIVDSLIQFRTRLPIEVFTEYHVPNYVNKDSLVIVSSYSGNTEETISAFQEAIKRGAQVFGISTGGKLSELLKKEGLPRYIYIPKENPAKQPRLALGYSVSATLAVLAKCGLVSIAKEEIKSIILTLKEFIKDFDIDVSESRNLAKKTALKLKGKIPILIGSEHLVGSIHAFKNFLNEGAKTFSVLFDIPELNHHLMEGLRNPAKVKQYLYILFFESKLYTSRISKRYPITREVVEKNEVDFGVYQLGSSKKIEQCFEVLVFASYVHFYLAFLYGVDPIAIPWVDYFKEKLSSE